MFGKESKAASIKVLKAEGNKEIEEMVNQFLEENGGEVIFIERWKNTQNGTWDVVIQY